MKAIGNATKQAKDYVVLSICEQLGIIFDVFIEFGFEFFEEAFYLQMTIADLPATIQQNLRKSARLRADLASNVAAYLSASSVLSLALTGDNT